MEKIKYIIGNKEHAEEIRDYLASFDKEVARHYTGSNYSYDNVAFFIDPDSGLASSFRTDAWVFKALVEAGVFEELKYPYSKPKLKVIQGDPDRGNEVIALLESLGGKITVPQSGKSRINYYYINELNVIEYRTKTSKFFDDYELEVLTLPEKIVFIPKLKVIKGNPDRGDEVIKMLETLGGYSNNGCDGSNDNCYYFVNSSSARCDGKNPIMFFSCTSSYFDDYDLEILTLPKKVEKPKLQVIQGDPDRGNDVIDLLRGLGGINMNCLLGKDTDQYYYINDDKIINCTSFDSDVFKSYNLEVLTLPVKGGYNKKSETAKFVPFVSKVLVRTNPGSWWIPAFYFSEETEGGTRRYRIVGSDSTYRECIPYEGNEELAFTWDNPEDI